MMTAMAPVETRWTRLERYARWKSKRLHLDWLPHDVLTYISNQFLTPRDTRALLHALIGYAPRPFVRADILAIPESMRASWLINNAYEFLIASIQDLSDICFFHAHDYARVSVFADWSPFTSRKPHKPVAFARWRSYAQPHGYLHIDKVRLYQCLLRACYAGRPCMHLAVYREFIWNHVYIMNPQPLLQTSTVFWPHFIFGKCMVR